MIKLKLIILGTLIFSALSAQDFVMKEKLADKYFNQFDYYKAIPMYEQLVKGNPGNYRVNEKLAESYRKINDNINAEHYYALLLDSSSVKKEYILYYAQALAHNGKYKESAEWYSKYGKEEPADKRSEGFNDAYKNISKMMSDSSCFQISKSPFCTQASDFSPAFYGNRIVFASSRKKQTAVKTSYNWTNSSYLDLYIVNPDSATAEPFSEVINSVYHEGPLTFSKNLDTIIFTRSNYSNHKLGKNSEGVNKLKMYQAVKKAGTDIWTNIKELPFNNNEYSVGHPSLSKDGNTLYFTSDMPGGIGGTDIYSASKVSDKNGNNTWSEPVNLGPEINSMGNEMFPFTDNEGRLWFASNGLPGLGGLDVFVSEKESGVWSKPVNTGYPMNTRFDDFGYISDNSGRDGYISSDRNNQPGNDDIFRVRYTAPEKAEIQPAPEIKLHELKLKGNVFSADKFAAIEGAAVYLANKKDNSETEIKSDNNGTFSFSLNPESDYTVRVSVKITDGNCVSSVEELTTRGLKTDTVLTASFPVFCTGDVIKVENIYYDLGKSDIKPEAALELDKVFDLMNRFRGMKIELRSHTDSRGSGVSNMTLSDSRARTAAQYLFSKGIEKDRIISRGYGETMPLNRCTDGVKCTEEDYRINRRTEFRIISLE